MFIKFISIICAATLTIGQWILPLRTDPKPFIERPIYEQMKGQEPIFFADNVFVKHEDPKEIDYGEFNASYNPLATTAQMKIGETFYGNSLLFISKCSIDSNLTDVIPFVASYGTWINYFNKMGQYYRGNAGCLPMAGDIVFLDKNFDKSIDYAEIVTFQYNQSFYTVGVNEDGIVSEYKYLLGDESIMGVCKPDYNVTRMEQYYGNNFIFNAVDTVVALTKQEYADCLAENGIEVIARYINPEGRVPLSKEEAQLYFNAGIRVMMIYQVGANDPYVGYDLGYEMGKKALEYARNLEATQGTPIFFCCDSAPKFFKFSKVAEFLCGVKDAMQSEYAVGLYGGYYVTEAMYNLGLIDAYWQCWGFSDRYVSNNFDMLQWSNGTYFFDKIPYQFDANYVKNIESVSYILE